jgi:hypothetical protein
MRSGFSFVLLGEHPPNRSHDSAVSSGSRPEVRELFDLLVDLVVLRDEHLAEGARVDEAQQPALRER